MVQVIDEGGNFATRFGSNLGQALSEQVPKEVERYRLSRGLNQLLRKPGQTPLGLFAGALGLPGMTPQGIESLGRLAREAGTREDLKSLSYRGMPGSSRMGQYQAAEPRRFEEKETVKVSEDEPRKRDQIVTESEIGENVVPRGRWTQERYNQERAKVIDEFKQYTPEQVDNEVDRREARWMSQTEGKQKEIDYLKNRQAELRSKIQDRAINKLGANVKKTTSTGELVGIDTEAAGIPGAVYEEILSQAEETLRNNPKLTIDSVAESSSKDLLDFSKNTTAFKNDFGNQWALNYAKNPERYRKKLKQYAKPYLKYNVGSDFVDELKTIGMSPQGAANIVYPPNEKIRKSINSLSKKHDESFWRDVFPYQKERTAKEYFDAIKGNIEDNDSLLSIAQQIELQNPDFDMNYFLDFLQENQDNLRLTERQRREIGQQSTDWFKKVADLILLPWGENR